MLGVTLFGIFLTPVFYYVIQWFNDFRIAQQGACAGAFCPLAGQFVAASASKPSRGP